MQHNIIQQDVTLDVASSSPTFQTKVFPKSSRHQFCARRFRGCHITIVGCDQISLQMPKLESSPVMLVLSWYFAQCGNYEVCSEFLFKFCAYESSMGTRNNHVAHLKSRCHHHGHQCWDFPQHGSRLGTVVRFPHKPRWHPKCIVRSQLFVHSKGWWIEFSWHINDSMIFRKSARNRCGNFCSLWQIGRNHWILLFLWAQEFGFAGQKTVFGVGDLRVWWNLSIQA